VVCVNKGLHSCVYMYAGGYMTNKDAIFEFILQFEVVVPRSGISIWEGKYLTSRLVFLHWKTAAPQRTVASE
jgi:hypothetical protein